MKGTCAKYFSHKQCLLFLTHEILFSKGFSIILISSVIEFSTSAFDYMVIMNKIWQRN